MGYASNPQTARVVPTIPGAPPNPTTQPNVFQQSSQALTSGIGAANSAAAYRPTNVSAQSVTAGQLSNTNLNPYLNPYTQNVIDTSMGALNRARQMTMNDVGAAATAANAFGGSRQGIVEAETNRGFADQAGQMAAQLNMQNFLNAQGMGQFDIGNRLQAATSNQGASLQAGMANQQAQQAAAANQLNAAGMFGNLSQQGFNMGNTINQQQQQFGTMQQAINQALIDAARNQYAGFAGAPGQSLAYPLAAVGGANMGQGTTTEQKNPGLLQYLSLGLGGL